MAGRGALEQVGRVEDLGREVVGVAPAAVRMAAARDQHARVRQQQRHRVVQARLLPAVERAPGLRGRVPTLGVQHGADRLVEEARGGAARHQRRAVGQQRGRVLPASPAHRRDRGPGRRPREQVDDLDRVGRRGQVRVERAAQDHGPPGPVHDRRAVVAVAVGRRGDVAPGAGAGGVEVARLRLRAGVEDLAVRGLEHPRVERLDLAGRGQRAPRPGRRRRGVEDLGQVVVHDVRAVAVAAGHGQQLAVPQRRHGRIPAPVGHVRVRDPRVAGRVVRGSVRQALVVDDVPAGGEQAAVAVERVPGAERVVAQHGGRGRRARARRVPQPRLGVAAGRAVVAIPEQHLPGRQQVRVDRHAAEVQHVRLPLPVRRRAAGADDVQVVDIVVSGQPARAPGQHHAPLGERQARHEDVVDHHLGRPAERLERHPHGRPARRLGQAHVGVDEAARGHVGQGGELAGADQRAVEVQRDVVVVGVARVLVDVEAHAQRAREVRLLGHELRPLGRHAAARRPVRGVQQRQAQAVGAAGDGSDAEVEVDVDLGLARVGLPGTEEHAVVRDGGRRGQAQQRAARRPVGIAQHRRGGRAHVLAGDEGGAGVVEVLVGLTGPGWTRAQRRGDEQSDSSGSGGHGSPLAVSRHRLGGEGSAAGLPRGRGWAMNVGSRGRGRRPCSSP